jgi:hypothetical protein
VQQHTRIGRRRTESRADRQDAHVLDAGVRQQPLEVALLDQVQRGQQQRKHAEDQQHAARKAAA